MNINILLNIFRGYVYFRGVHLLILKKIPGGTFIQGGTFIKESRVQEEIGGIRPCRICSPALKPEGALDTTDW